VLDLHAHVLPGLDDGPATVAESLEFARAAVADGISVLAATPHVREDYPTTPEAMERALAVLRAAVAEAALPLEVRSGGEIALERLPSLDADARARFGLAGNPDYLLLEFPYVGWPLSLPDEVFRLVAGGVTPVIGHPERNADVQAEPERLRPLVDAGALVQLTAASVDGRLGRRCRDAAFGLLDLELAHFVASDGHGPEIRAVGLSSAAEAIGDSRLAEWLVVGVPAAIIEGGPIPDRPAVAPRSRLARRLWR
jgi:protein-tyrosine phosphatase